MDQSGEIARVFNKYANSYRDRFSSLNLYNDTYDFFLGLLPKSNAKILEIGCGPGNITNYLLSQQPSLDILGIDLAEEMLAVAAEYNPHARFRKMDCCNVAALTEKFDAVICGFCLPYLSKEDCSKLIADSADLLNEKGIIYLSAIEGNYENSAYETSSNREDKLFIYYYNEKFLAEKLRSNNFEIRHTILKSYQKADGTQNTHLIIIAIKK
jgi:trans-aconitate methyltransferase